MLFPEPLVFISHPRPSYQNTHLEVLRQELKTLRDRNLQESAFDERVDLAAKLGIKILPSEDLKSRKISCRLNLVKENEEREQAGFAKVTFGGPFGTVPGLLFEKKRLILAIQQLLVST